METDDDQQHLEEGKDYSHPCFSSGTSLICWSWKTKEFFFKNQIKNKTFLLLSIIGIEYFMGLKRLLVLIYDSTFFYDFQLDCNIERVGSFSCYRGGVYIDCYGTYLCCCFIHGRKSTLIGG